MDRGERYCKREAVDVSAATYAQNIPGWFTTARYASSYGHASKRSLYYLAQSATTRVSSIYTPDAFQCQCTTFAADGARWTPGANGQGAEFAAANYHHSISTGTQWDQNSIS